MKRNAVGAFFLILAAGFPVTAGPASFSPELGRDRQWDDGKAEYSVYDALELRDGVARPARVVHIVVKEPFNAALRVKADAPTGAEVLKMNQVIDVPTGVSAVHQMVSLFWGRTTGDLTKISLASSDSCGNTFKLGWLDGSNLRVTYHSYWDGEGDGSLERRLPGGTLFYDELPWKLRELSRPDVPGSYEIALVPSIVGSRLGSFDPVPAKIVIAPPTKDNLRIDVVHGGQADRFVFDRAAPRVLRLWIRPDGSRLTLKKTQRLDCSRYNRTGDEKLLD